LNTRESDSSASAGESEKSSKPNVRLSLCAKELQSHHNLSNAEADEVFDDREIDLELFTSNPKRAVQHPNLLVEIYGYRYPWDIGLHFLVTQYVYGRDVEHEELQELLQQQIQIDKAQIKKKMKKGIQVKALAKPFTIPSASAFLQKFQAGNLRMMSLEAAKVPTIRPKLNLKEKKPKKKTKPSKKKVKPQKRMTKKEQLEAQRRKEREIREKMEQQAREQMPEAVSEDLDNEMEDSDATDVSATEEANDQASAEEQEHDEEEEIGTEEDEEVIEL